MKFSLITVTTGERPEELARLKRSLAGQTFGDFEHIVIDHRDYPELDGGLSKARNLGLSMAVGDVVAFPDDDMWYGPSALADAAAAFADDKLDGVSFRMVDQAGRCAAGGWMSAGQRRMNAAVIWHTAVSGSFFVKRSTIGGFRFDTRLGVGSGTRFGSGEETDFLLSLIEHGANIMYDGTKQVFHPSVSVHICPSRGWLYGNGCGAVLRRHGYSVVRLLWMAALQVVRALQACAMLRPSRAFFHLAMAAGRVAGYVCPCRLPAV